NWAKFVREDFMKRGGEPTDKNKFHTILDMVKDRCSLLTDFYDQSFFFFKAPGQYDFDAAKSKWSDEKKKFFESWAANISRLDKWDLVTIENDFKALALEKNIKPGELQLPLRIMFTGGKFGPPVFQIAEVLGKEETITRIQKALSKF
ncbi:MAG TPA: hypothetical protein VLJ68_03290, partial [Chitinophagaceae bacterium]|nr:hypothetical protein [Chitinophagaceae bacterium]